MGHEEWFTTSPRRHLIAQRRSKCTHTHAQCTQSTHKEHTQTQMISMHIHAHHRYCCCSVAKSCLTLPHRLQYVRLPCPSLSQSLLRFMSIKSTMLSNHLILCHPLLLLPSIFPNIRVFSTALHIKWPMIGASASASVLLMYIQDWFPLGLTGLISLQSKGFSRVFSCTTIWKHQFFSTQPSLWSNSHIRTWLLKKP